METNVEEIKGNVCGLIKKAENADKSDDAMRYAQAALNATHAYLGLTTNSTTR